MKTIFFLTFFALCLNQPPLESVPKLHVMTVASHPARALDQLIHSAKYHHYDLTVVGLGLPYQGNGQKLTYIKDYLKSLPEEDLFLFVDAYDVFFQSDESLLIEKFLTFSAPFVIGAETGCYPFSHLACHYPESPTRFQYINSGTFMGYVGFIKQLLDNLGSIDETKSDQGQLSLYYVDHPTDFCLDYHCELFIPMFQISLDDFLINRTQRTITSLLTGTVPCILHGNGQDKRLYQHLFEQLFWPF